VRGALVQMGTQKIDRKRWDWDEVARNPFFCPDAEGRRAVDEISRSGAQARLVLRRARRSGGRRHSRGLGAPIYGKLDADLAGALMSINAVKGVRSATAWRRRRCPAKRTPTRCARAKAAASRNFSPITPAAFWAASRPASRSSRASP
jgi:chorismate synthase